MAFPGGIRTANGQSKAPVLDNGHHDLVAMVPAVGFQAAYSWVASIILASTLASVVRLCLAPFFL